MIMAVSALVGTMGVFSVTVALIVLGLLSQRLGAVTKMQPHYRWFYVAAGLTFVSVISRLVYVGYQDERIVLVYTSCFALGSTIGLAVAWRYWNWLFGER
ncbi:MAG: hypothetical protein JXN59_06950 [Anaerolineae bacterium]|nr:hypothetical protein [Anaerolineae bacterium]